MPHRASRRDPYGAGARWKRRTILAKAGYIFATLMAVVVVAAALAGYAKYRQLDANIKVVNVGGLSGRTVYGAQNILILGSQERAHQRGHFGVGSGASPLTSNSDNLLLVHLDPTHTHATVLSIPRDMFVYEPGCKARDRMIGIGIQGPYTYPPGNIIDGALNIGGPTCAVKTAEDLTGIKLDHFVEFDFNSFRDMVGAIGGVEVCVPHGGYHDRKSHINLSRGLHLLNYTKALDYVRTRDSLGGPDAGGDLPRIELQQAFISSVVQKVNKQGMLSNIPVTAERREHRHQGADCGQVPRLGQLADEPGQIAGAPEVQGRHADHPADDHGHLRVPDLRPAPDGRAAAGRRAVSDGPHRADLERAPAHPALQQGPRAGGERDGPDRACPPHGGQAAQAGLRCHQRRQHGRHQHDDGRLRGPGPGRRRLHAHDRAQVVPGRAEHARRAAWQVGTPGPGHR